MLARLGELKNCSDRKDYSAKACAFFPVTVTVGNMDIPVDVTAALGDRNDVVYFKCFFTDGFTTKTADSIIQFIDV